MLAGLWNEGHASTKRKHSQLPSPPIPPPSPEVGPSISGERSLSALSITPQCGTSWWGFDICVRLSGKLKCEGFLQGSRGEVITHMVKTIIYFSSGTQVIDYDILKCFLNKCTICFLPWTKTTGSFFLLHLVATTMTHLRIAKMDLPNSVVLRKGLLFPIQRMWQ